MSKTDIRIYTRIAHELGYHEVYPNIDERIAHASSESEVEHLFVMCRHLLSD